MDAVDGVLRQDLNDVTQPVVSTARDRRPHHVALSAAYRLLSRQAAAVLMRPVGGECDCLLNKLADGEVPKDDVSRGEMKWSRK